MSNIMDVYCTNIQAQHYPLLDIKPSLLFDEIDPQEVGDYYRCPANKTILNKILVVKSPVDLEYDIVENNNNELGESSLRELGELIITPRAPRWIKDILNSNATRTKNNQIIVQFNLVSCYLLSEESTAATILPPFLHDSPLNKYKLLPGEYDISKWYRSLHPALILPNDQEKIVVKRGQVLFYILLNTDKKINLVHYHATDKLLDYITDCNNVTHFTPKKNLKYRYNLFDEKKFKDKILNEIKQHLE